MKQDTNEMELIFDSCSENEGFAKIGRASCRERVSSPV